MPWENSMTERKSDSLGCCLMEFNRFTEVQSCPRWNNQLRGPWPCTRCCRIHILQALMWKPHHPPLGESFRFLVFFSKGADCAENGTINHFRWSLNQSHLELSLFFFPSLTLTRDHPLPSSISDSSSTDPVLALGMSSFLWFNQSSSWHFQERMSHSLRKMKLVHHRR